MSFDPNLFKKNKDYAPYVSFTTEIKPFNSNDDFATLVLDKNKTASVSVSSLFSFIVKNKINLQSNIFLTPFILDRYGEPHVEENYQKWLSHTENQKLDSISFEELIPGNIYLLDDEKSYFLYLGKKFTISYNIVKKNGDIKVSKIQPKYIGYTVYKHDNLTLSGPKELYFNRAIFLSSPQKVIKFVQQGDVDLIDKLLKIIEIAFNFLYFKDVAPSFKNFKLEFKEISENDLLEYGKYVSFVNCWHKLNNGRFLGHHSLSVYSADGLKYSRQMSSGYIYGDNLTNYGLSYFNSRSFYKINETPLAGMLECSNDNFLIAPDNYYRLSIIPK